MEEKSQLTFRISLWRPWLLALTPLALLAAVGVAVSVVAGERRFVVRSTSTTARGTEHAATHSIKPA